MSVDSRCPENGRGLPEEPVFPCHSVSEQSLDGGISLADADTLHQDTAVWKSALRFLY